MNKLYRYAVFAAALLFGCPGFAAEGAASHPGDIEISAAWTRATAPGQDAASVDMTITSKRAATLIGVSSPAAAAAELHSMTSKDGMMSMREVQAIALPAGKPVNLGDSGYHVMLTGLKAPLKEGGSVPLTLTFRLDPHLAVKIRTGAEVRSLHTTGDAGQGGGQMHMRMQ